MAVNDRKDNRRRDTYWVGDVADAPLDGHVWIDNTSGNGNALAVFRNGTWVTPGMAAPTFTGTTTVTTLTSTTINNSGVVTSGGLTVASTFNASNQRIILGQAAVPTAATSLVGIIQIGGIPGTPTLLTSVPTTGSVFLTFDTVHRSIAAKIGGSWFQTPWMELY